MRACRVLLEEALLLHARHRGGRAGFVRAIVSGGLCGNPRAHRVYYCGPMFRCVARVTAAQPITHKNCANIITHTHTTHTHTHTDIHAHTYTVGITRARMQTHALMPTITPLTPCAAMSGHRRGECGSLHNLVRRASCCLRRVWLISGLCGRPCGPRRVQAWRCLGSRLRRQTWK